MSGRTHLLVGANVAWVAVIAGWDAGSVLLTAFVGAWGALLPDVDAQSAVVHRMGGGALGAFRGAFTHRGFFHSFLAVALLGGAAWWGFAAWHPAFPLALTLGYASHLLIDGLNFKGTRYLFPWRAQLHLVPKWLASPIGGVADQMLFILGALGLFLLAVRMMPSLSAVGFPMMGA